MTITLPPEMEVRIKESARQQGLTVDRYVEHLIEETVSRESRVSQFQRAISERLELLSNGDTVDGEEVMARLISELPAK